VTLGRYALVVATTAGLSLGLFLSTLFRGLDARGRLAAVAGALLAAVNSIVAYGLALWSKGRSTKAFMGAVLGGTLGRMAVLLAAVTGAILLLELPRVPLVASLLGYFIVFLVVELVQVQRMTSGGAQ
jgi:hypothetical protein